MGCDLSVCCLAAPGFPPAHNSFLTLPKTDANDPTRQKNQPTATNRQTAYERARAILTSHESELHTLAGALLEKETLSGEQIRAVMATGKTVAGKLTGSTAAATAAAQRAAGAAAAAAVMAAGGKVEGGGGGGGLPAGVQQAGGVVRGAAGAAAAAAAGKSPAGA